jgi:predicted permease
MRIVRRLLFWGDARRHAADLAAEIEDHRARLQRAFEADGFPAAEAAARSRRAMGNVTLAREDARDVWVVATLEYIWRDARYAMRALRREPTFALTALLTLALGAATTITVFSIVDAELWKPLPFPEPKQLVTVKLERPGARFDMISLPDLADWNAQGRLTQFVGVQPGVHRVLGGVSPQSVTVRPVTSNYFTVLGLSPSLGRAFGPEDERAPTAIVTDAAWHRLFNGDQAIVGRNVTLDGRSYGVVGVLANQRLEFTSEPDFFVAIDRSALGFEDRQALTLDSYGRMRTGVSIGQAQAEIQAIVSRIAAAFPQDRAHQVARLYDLQAYSTGFNWRQLYLFLSAAALMMILSCLNVANLLLSRALRRQREFAIRGALGGGRVALVRQLMVEGAMLALPGAAMGALGSLWLLRIFTALVPSDMLERGGHIALDSRVTGFVLALSFVTTVALALSPFVFARRIGLNTLLGGTRTAERSPHQRAGRGALLIAQVTATLVLLAAAGLFVLSFTRLAQTPVGFEPRDRVLLRLTLPAARYTGDASITAFTYRLIEQARAIAGIRNAAVGSSLPLNPGGGPAVRIIVPDRPRPAPGSEPIALLFGVSPAYFRTLGIGLLDGREFGANDAAGSARVAVVNERLARTMFPGERATGRTLEIVPGSPRGWAARPGLVTIVGIVANVKNFSISEVDFNDLYLPFAQAPAANLELAVATTVAPAAVVAPLRTAATRLDPALPFTSITFMTDRVTDTLKQARFNLALIALFAALAVILAGVGIYGSMACAIEERTREFGVRIALGALPRRILGEALRESIRVGFAGCLLGTLLVLVLARVLGNALYLVPGQHGGLLYQVGMTNPTALGAASALLIAVAILAGFFPARRATRVDPLIALRSE